MPVKSDADLPLDYVAITGPAGDEFERRLETTSDPKIAAQDLRHNIDDVRAELFSDIRTLVESTARRFATPARAGRR